MTEQLELEEQYPLIKKDFLTFVRSNHYERIFPRKLNQMQRKLVHYLAMQFGFHSKSFGQGKMRQILVSKVSEGIDYDNSNTYCSRRWSIKKATEWYNNLNCWLIGCNYICSNAVNQLEMWQSRSFDLDTIRNEFQLCKSLGFNVLRVYLHDLVWYHENETFVERIDKFLETACSFGLLIIFVLFDDCHRPSPQYGEQPLPIARVHNSGWVHSPGKDIVEEIHNKSIRPKELSRLKSYVQSILSKFSGDNRILMWDLYNEPGQSQNDDMSNDLLEMVWEWAHEIRPSQPLTSCLDGSIGKKNISTNAKYSDVLTFHWYHGNSLEYRILNHYNNCDGRPIICTEYMARELGTTFELSLPIFQKYNIGCCSWGLVAGKTQTHFNWETVSNLEAYKERKLYLHSGDAIDEPQLWFHDIFRTDGSPFNPVEIEIIKSFTHSTAVSEN